MSLNSEALWNIQIYYKWWCCWAKGEGCLWNQQCRRVDVDRTHVQWGSKRCKGGGDGISSVMFCLARETKGSSKAAGWAWVAFYTTTGDST